MRTILFGKASSTQCRKVKSFLDAKEIEFEFVDIDNPENGGNIGQSMRLQEANTLFQATDSNVWLFYNGEFHGYAKAIRLLEGME